MNLIFKKETHQYFVNEEEKISVSKILDNYLGSSYDKIPKAILQPAIIRGNAVHKVAYLYFKNINCENVVETIKVKIKKTPVFTEKILKYCDNLLNYLYLHFHKLENNQQYISEQMYYTDIVAGTPDLIFWNTFNQQTIVDFKTYKTMTKELRYKAELQLTAYHWLLEKNGFTLSNTHFIIWIKENKVETISVEITKEKIYEWKMALAIFKENWNEPTNSY